MKVANSHRDSVVAFDTKHALIITKQKIGTNFVMSFFISEGIYSSPNMFISYDVIKSHWNIEYASTGHIKEGESFQRHKQSMNSFLNSETRKDIIILIRNPYERFKSAIIQDLVKSYITPGPFGLATLGSYILENEVGSKDKRTMWWRDNNDKIGELSENMDTFTKDEEHSEVSQDCLRIIFKALLSKWASETNKIDLPHNQPYHTTIQNMIIGARNTKNIKLFDIDKVNLNEVFSKYTVGSQTIPKNNQSGILKKIVNELIELEEFKSVKEKFAHDCRFEVTAYNVLSIISQKENK